MMMIISCFFVLITEMTSLSDDNCHADIISEVQIGAWRPQ